jgi:16S rRNA (uracil1498-N3)-methyltransferase
LKEAVAALSPGTKVLVLDESEHTVTLSQAFAPLAGTEVPVAFVIGPEGGLSRAEVEALKGAGASPVSLGKLILRTETAALAGLAVLRHLDGELG